MTAVVQNTCKAATLRCGCFSKTPVHATHAAPSASDFYTTHTGTPRVPSGYPRRRQWPHSPSRHRTHHQRSLQSSTRSNDSLPPANHTGSATAETPTPHAPTAYHLRTVFPSRDRSCKAAHTHHDIYNP